MSLKTKNPRSKKTEGLTSSPPRRLTSVYDLAKPGGYRRILLKVSGYKPGLLPRTQEVPLSYEHSQKTLLVATNAAVNLISILIVFLKDAIDHRVTYITSALALDCLLNSLTNFWGKK